MQAWILGWKHTFQSWQCADNSIKKAGLAGVGDKTSQSVKSPPVSLREINPF